MSEDELANLDEDEDNIDFFLSNQEKFTVCEYYLKGNCRYGDKCKFLHPKNRPKESKKKDEEKEDFILDDECCICLERVLKNGK